MLKRYFCGGLVAVALLGGCGENYTTTDTASTRKETRVEDNRGSSVDASARGNQQPAQGSTSVSVETGSANNSSAPNSGEPDMSSVDPTDGSTPATFGQTVEDDQVADNAGPARPVEDVHFVTEAAKGGMKEVQLGRLASEKGSNAEVKRFAQQMVADHSKANEELKSLARQEGFTLPASDASNANVHADISQLKGAQFDKKYADMMVKDHEKTVALFEKQANEGQDTALKAWAAEKLPTLKHHLQMAKEMQISLK